MLIRKLAGQLFFCCFRCCCRDCVSYKRSKLTQQGVFVGRGRKKRIDCVCVFLGFSLNDTEAPVRNVDSVWAGLCFAFHASVDTSWRSRFQSGSDGCVALPEILQPNLSGKKKKKNLDSIQKTSQTSLTVTHKVEPVA